MKRRPSSSEARIRELELEVATLKGQLTAKRAMIDALLHAAHERAMPAPLPAPVAPLPFIPIISPPTQRIPGPYEFEPLRPTYPGDMWPYGYPKTICGGVAGLTVDGGVHGLTIDGSGAALARHMADTCCITIDPGARTWS